jgi:hypothetical protein
MIDLDQWFWQHFQERCFLEGGGGEREATRELIFSNPIMSRHVRKHFITVKKSPGADANYYTHRKTR